MTLGAARSFGAFVSLAVVFPLGFILISESVLPETAMQDADSAWSVANPNYEWSFPRDHWAHRGYKTEWWYFTGQLMDVADTTKRFGYQFTFFKVGIVPEALPVNSAWAVTDLVMGHAALTDISSGEHRFSELIYRANGFLGAFQPAGDSLVAWSSAPTGTDGQWRLSWRGDGFEFSAVDARERISLRLDTRQTKSLLFQGPNGFSRKGEGPTSASLYYTLPRLATEGTISIDGTDYSVTGESWMDKEFGSNLLGEGQVGWDWFSLRLDDGRDLMLYMLRDSDGAVDYARATLNSRQGIARYLTGEDFRIESLGSWRSSETDAVYPVSWLIEIPTEGISLTVSADVANQENVSRLVPNLFYWEGSVQIADPAGVRIGQGYVELTGYGSAVPLGI